MVLEHFNQSYTWDDIEHMVEKEHKDIIVFEGEVYDVADFKPTHPGGPKYIDDYIGKDMTEAFYDADHSRIAKRLLKETKIGVLDGDNTNDTSSNSSDSDKKEKEDRRLREMIDPTKGTVYQVFKKLNKEDYIAFINDPKHLTKPGEDQVMFATPYFEPFSRTPWWLVPLVWIPIFCYKFFLAFETLDLKEVLLMIAIGVVVWTFLEYTLHRFLFHLEIWMPDNSYFIAFHYIIHGVHHAFPMDRHRLVFPPVLALVIYYVLYYLIGLIIPETHIHGLAAGAIASYMIYDLGHYYIHHEQPLKVVEYRKKYHMYHHYKDPDNGYGITTSFWDKVFGTELDLSKKNKTY